MSGANILFVAVGALALVAGVVMMIIGLRAGVEGQPRNTLLLIAGMMATAFGLILGGFAIGYATTAPLDLDSGAAT